MDLTVCLHKQGLTSQRTSSMAHGDRQREHVQRRRAR